MSRPIGDRFGFAEQVKGVLAHVGIDTAHERPFDFFLYLPTESAAVEAGRELAEAGFHCNVRPAARGNDWLCLARATIVPTDEALSAIGYLMELTAEDFGGAFDGWETEASTH